MNRLTLSLLLLLILSAGNHVQQIPPIPSIEDRYNMMIQLVPHIPLEAVNQTMQQLFGQDNRVEVSMTPR